MAAFSAPIFLIYICDRYRCDAVLHKQIREHTARRNICFYIFFSKRERMSSAKITEGSGGQLNYVTER